MCQVRHSCRYGGGLEYSIVAIAKLSQFSVYNSHFLMSYPQLRCLRKFFAPKVTQLFVLYLFGGVLPPQRVFMSLRFSTFVSRLSD